MNKSALIILATGILMPTIVVAGSLPPQPTPTGAPVPALIAVAIIGLISGIKYIRNKRS